jgi:hypothetical protein
VEVAHFAEIRVNNWGWDRPVAATVLGGLWCARLYGGSGAIGQLCLQRAVAIPVGWRLRVELSCVQSLRFNRYAMHTTDLLDPAAAEAAAGPLPGG